jgi:hypothetical protein
MVVWEGYPEELCLEIAFYLEPRDILALSHVRTPLANFYT